MLQLLLFSLGSTACGLEPLPVAVDIQTGSAQSVSVNDPDLDPALIATRPFSLQVAASYDGTPTPLLLALHGMGDTGSNFVQFSGFSTLAQTRGYLLAYPNGQTMPVSGSPKGWNASFTGLFNGAGMTDEVDYLRAVIADVSASYSVDADRVFVVGYSNGGFMANVLACIASDRVAAVASISGTLFDGDVSACQPVKPVAVMHTHGTNDGTVGYNGGAWQFGLVSVSYVSATDLAALWVDKGNCPATPQSSTADTEPSIVGDETDVEAWGPCDQATDVELLTVNGGSHQLSFGTAFRDSIGDFFDAHPRATTTNTVPSQPLVCTCDRTTICDGDCICDPECDDEGCAATPASFAAAMLALGVLVIRARRGKINR